jgi:hypothetical protein
MINKYIFYVLLEYSKIENWTTFHFLFYNIFIVAQTHDCVDFLITVKIQKR